MCKRYPYQAIRTHVTLVVLQSNPGAESQEQVDVVDEVIDSPKLEISLDVLESHHV